MRQKRLRFSVNCPCELKEHVERNALITLLNVCDRSAGETDPTPESLLAEIRPNSGLPQSSAKFFVDRLHPRHCERSHKICQRS